MLNPTMSWVIRRYGLSCIVYLWLTEQAIGFNTQNFKTYINEFITTNQVHQQLSNLHFTAIVKNVSTLFKHLIRSSVFNLQGRRLILEGKFTNNQISISILSAIRIDAHVIYLIWKPNQDFHLSIQPIGKCITYISSNPIWNQCFTVNQIWSKWY